MSRTKSPLPVAMRAARAEQRRALQLQRRGPAPPPPLALAPPPHTGLSGQGELALTAMRQRYLEKMSPPPRPLSLDELTGRLALLRYERAHLIGLLALGELEQQYLRALEAQITQLQAELPTPPPTR